MKAYKITYMRIGYNEPWAGWKIAGKSSELPGTVSDEYFRMQSANSTSPIVTGMLDNKKPIWEYVFNGKYIYISKLQYGFFDQSPESRPSMRADGVAFLTQENPELMRKPYLALLVSDKQFDNHPVIETMYPKLCEKNVSTVNLAQSDILTAYDSVEEITDTVNLRELVSKYFPNISILKTVIKCALWAISEKSNPSISLIFDGDDNDKKKIIYIISALLPIALRNGVSFRTSNINELKPLKFVFGNEKGARYLDLSNGQNNIVIENKLNARYEKYDFINYPIDHLDNIETYFDYCYKVMDDLGDVASTDLNYLKIVHDIVLDEYLDSSHVMGNMEILKKFLDFISVPLNNERIDWYCAKLLETIIDNNIQLNDQLKQRLQSKLKITQSEALKNVGYGYDALNMVNSGDKEKEFKFLASVRTEVPSMFKTYLEKITATPGGTGFLDQFYGKSVYITDTIKDGESLVRYKEETDTLKERRYVEQFISEKCNSFGKLVCVTDYMNGKDIRVAKENYIKLLEKIYQTDKNKIDIFVRAVCLEFWSSFDIAKFRYKYKNIYLLFACNDNQKFKFVKSLIGYFEKISAQEEDLPQRFGNFLTESLYKPTPDELKALRYEFREVCITCANTNNHIDFWYGIARLIPGDFVRFIISNEINVFIDGESLARELADSSFFSNSVRVNRLLYDFENYEYSAEEKPYINEIIKTLKDYQKKVSKEREKQQKDKERALKKEKQAKTVEVRAKKDDSDNDEKHSGGAHYDKKHGVFGKLFGKHGK